jgi:hypothetical protein
LRWHAVAGFARNDCESSSAKGMVTSMSIYNTGILIVLLYAGIGLGLSELGLWIVILVHSAMFLWCFMNMLKNKQELIK